jgi:hypothetical protein
MSVIGEVSNRTSHQDPSFNARKLTPYQTGGRTAWSATVELQGQTFSARFWYDGQHVDNAREDVADLVLTYIKSSPGSLAGKEGASFPSFSRAERERFANH